MFTSASGFALGTTLIALALFAGMLAALALGQRVSRRRAGAGVDAPAGAGAIGAAIFALLGLLIAFTFSGAAARFDARKELVVQETNAIGTAYLRLDLLQPSARAELQAGFRRYLDARISAFQAKSAQEFRSEEARATVIQGELWSRSVKATAEAGAPAAQLLLPALNDVIDITTTRDGALELHPPLAIYVVLILLALFAALLAGIEMAPSKAEWVLKMVFAATITLTISLTVDLEHPRLGLIRVSDTDHFMIDLRRSMK